MYQHYPGVDVHKRRSYTVLMDAQGNISDHRRPSHDAMGDDAAQLPEYTFAVLEAMGNWSYMDDMFFHHTTDGRMSWVLEIV